MIGDKIVYPGTFDPLTNGHLDLIERAGKLFKQVIVAIPESSSKTTLFTVEERVMIIKEVISNYPYAKLATFSGLLVDFLRQKQVFTILRGLRAITDFEYELQLANINRSLEPKIETVFLTPSEKHAYLSSSIIKEIASLGGDSANFVPQPTLLALKNKLANQS